MELQELDSKGSPHLEERWIGGNVDLDLLSHFPQRYARFMEVKVRSFYSWVLGTLDGF